MLNKLQGQPDSYDKKYGSEYPAPHALPLLITPVTEYSINSVGRLVQEHTGL